MDIYLLVRNLHILCAALSVLLFILRFALRQRNDIAPSGRFWRLAPHLIDTVLFCAGIWMAWISGQYALPWLHAKLTAILLYIVLGSYAFKRARTRRGRNLAFAGAMGCIAFVLHAAISRTPWF